MINKARQNFIDVLEVAYEDYYPKGKSTDIAAIVLGKLEENLHEGFNLADTLLEGMENLSEDRSLYEATDVIEPRIIKEKKGKGLSVIVKGTEYRYVSPNLDTYELYYKFTRMLSYGNSGFKALNWLKKNALQYYQAKARDFSPEGRELVGYTESNRQVFRKRLNESTEGIDDFLEDIAERIEDYFYKKTKFNVNVETDIENDNICLWDIVLKSKGSNRLNARKITIECMYDNGRAVGDFRITSDERDFRKSKQSTIQKAIIYIAQEMEDLMN